MWYAKMYFSEGREIFQYDSLGMQGVPDVQKEFPFSGKPACLSGTGLCGSDADTAKHH